LYCRQSNLCIELEPNPYEDLLDVELHRQTVALSAQGLPQRKLLVVLLLKQELKQLMSAAAKGG
jgi:hypothetical protein